MGRGPTHRSAQAALWPSNPNAPATPSLLPLFPPLPLLPSFIPCATLSTPCTPFDPLRKPKTQSGVSPMMMARRGMGDGKWYLCPNVLQKDCFPMVAGAPPHPQPLPQTSRILRLPRPSGPFVGDSPWPAHRARPAAGGPAEEGPPCLGRRGHAGPEPGWTWEGTQPSNLCVPILLHPGPLPCSGLPLPLGTTHNMVTPTAITFCCTRTDLN